MGELGSLDRCHAAAWKWLSNNLIASTINKYHHHPYRTYYLFASLPTFPSSSSFPSTRRPRPSVLLPLLSGLSFLLSRLTIPSWTLPLLPPKSRPRFAQSQRHTRPQLLQKQVRITPLHLAVGPSPAACSIGAHVVPARR